MHALLALDAETLSTRDIAEVNLLCAQGLPGTEELDIPRSLATLDAWAAHVGRETDRHYHKQFVPHPEEYRNSDGYYRILMMITVLQQDFGVRYNPDRIRDIDFTKSADLFIHGLLGGGGGTCVSMPVLYVAVGRRLGYPLRLVAAKSHVFARWDGPNERFNIEGTNRGLRCPEDQYYMSWPKSLTREEVRRGYFLKSLNAQQELSLFLGARGHCLEDTGRLHEAQVAYAHAHRLAPKSQDALGFLVAAVRKEDPAWPRSARVGRHGRSRAGTPRRPVDEELRQIRAIDEYNRRVTGGAMKAAGGRGLPGVPRPGRQPGNTLPVRPKGLPREPSVR